MITITRYFSNNEITLGVMSVDGIAKPFYTCELPWKNNERDISCIPKGNYTLKPHKSPSKGQCFDISCANREYILMHSGNVPSSSRGCILVGLYSGYMQITGFGKCLGVMSSVDAMKILKEHIKEPTELVIKNLYV